MLKHIIPSTTRRKILAFILLQDDPNFKFYSRQIHKEIGGETYSTIRELKNLAKGGIIKSCKKNTTPGESNYRKFYEVNHENNLVKDLTNLFKNNNIK